MRKSNVRMERRVYAILMLLLFAGSISAQQPAFPGAEGYGKYVSGGRGGHVVAVTNVLDDVDNPPEGSLRWALKQGNDTIPHPVLGTPILQPGKLTIVFRVSGIIELAGELHVSRDDITIAGQSAPGDGICLKNHVMTFRGKNIILRYLRFRPGLGGGSAALEKGVAALNVENCDDVIVDHCSFGWANEECAIFYDIHNITVQWCIAHEGLYDAGHAKGSRSYVGVWGGQGASFHHNLFTHNRSRTIRFNGARSNDTNALVDYRNNVNYNWGGSGATYGGEIQIRGGSSRANMVNNYYKPGPATSSSHYFLAPTNNTYGFTKFHLDGNYMDGSPDKTANNWSGVSLGGIPLEQIKYDDPFRMYEPLPTETAEEAFQSVLAKVGAVYPKRDTIDARVVHEALTGTATGTGNYGAGAHGIIDNPSVVGGYPEYLTYDVPDDVDGDGMDDAWELANGLDPSDPDDRNDIHESGYTMLEVYLNELVEDFVHILDPVVHVKRYKEGYCTGYSADYLLGYPRGGTFSEGPGLSVFGDSVIFTPGAPGDYDLKYVYSDGAGFADSVSETLVVLPLPEPSIVGLDSVHFTGDLVLISGDPLGGAFEASPGITVKPGGEAVFRPKEPGEYTIIYNYMNSFGCAGTDTARVKVTWPTGIEDRSSSSGIIVFPNPATGEVHIESSRPLLMIKMYDLAGSLLKEFSMPGKNTIQIGEFERGIYYLQIETETGSAIRKIVKI